jgi:hypothetical protein
MPLSTKDFARTCCHELNVPDSTLSNMPPQGEAQGALYLCRVCGRMINPAMDIEERVRAIIPDQLTRR